MNGVTFSTEDLLLNREEWVALVAVRRDLLCDPCRLWLSAWDACAGGFGQTVDEDLSRLRLGHYLGWQQRATSSQPLAAVHPSSG